MHLRSLCSMCIARRKPESQLSRRDCAVAAVQFQRSSYHQSALCRGAGRDAFARAEAAGYQPPSLQLGSHDADRAMLALCARALLIDPHLYHSHCSALRINKD
jgi:hypothetical protein